jgi:hypothetical protein
LLALLVIATALEMRDGEVAVESGFVRGCLMITDYRRKKGDIPPSWSSVAAIAAHSVYRHGKDMEVIEELCRSTELAMITV